jgi:hypothetical protein
VFSGQKSIWTPVHKIEATSQELAIGSSNRARARKKRPAKLLAYPHVTNEKLLRFRRGWVFLLVTRIL